MYYFKENKYTNWYFNIIETAKNRSIDGYVEKHHILPKSLGGGDNINNIVRLTGREHFIVHLLLIRMVDGQDVYKMVHAIIRFTAKVKNSKEYELLRKYVSKYSKGKYNKSFGKIWVHDEESQEIFYIPKEELLESSYKKGLSYQRGGFLDYIWINNTLNEMLISKNDIIPKGWNKGRIYNPDLSHMKFMSSKRHTKEKDIEHSKKLFGRKGITNTKTGAKRKIKPNELDDYLNSGWILTKKKQKRFYFEITFQDVTVCYNKLTEFAEDNGFNRNSLSAAMSYNKLPWHGVQRIIKREKLIP